MNRLASNLLLILLGLALLAGAGLLHPRLNQLRREVHLTAADPLENAPPLTAITTIALGGFRGLLVDALWLRASDLQDEGRYLELVQLADWITKLEPRNAEVWVFHAWNLAYNISVLMDAPEERWRWVQHGIDLLRSQGLLYNPGEPEIYQELSWIFLHKLAGESDRCHAHYKQQVAAQMTGLLGGGRPDYARLTAEQKARLWQECRLRAGQMQRLDAQYGPLDWTRPEAQALYWAVEGQPYAKGQEAVLLELQILQSLSAAFFRAAWMHPAPANAPPGFQPDLAVLPGLERAFVAARRRFRTMV